MKGFGLSLSIKLPGEVESTESDWIQNLRKYEKIEDENLKQFASDLYNECLIYPNYQDSNSTNPDHHDISHVMQIVFLDVDGVLIPVSEHSEFPCEIQTLKFAQVLEKCPKLKIVISSSWRKDRHTLYLLLAALKESGIDIYHRVIGCVPFDEDSEATINGRTRDVELWFKQLRIHQYSHIRRRKKATEIHTYHSSSNSTGTVTGTVSTGGSSSSSIFRHQTPSSSAYYRRRHYHQRSSLMSGSSDFSTADFMQRPGLILSDKSASVSEIIDSGHRLSSFSSSLDIAAKPMIPSGTFTMIADESSDTTAKSSRCVMNDESLFLDEEDEIAAGSSPSPWIRSTSETSVSNLSDVVVDHADSPPSEKSRKLSVTSDASTVASSTVTAIGASMVSSTAAAAVAAVRKCSGMSSMSASSSRADASRTISVDSSGADADLDDESDMTDCSALSSSCSGLTSTIYEESAMGMSEVEWISELPDVSLVICDYIIIDDLNLNKNKSVIINDHFMHTETDIGLTDLHCDMLVHRFK